MVYEIIKLEGGQDVQFSNLEFIKGSTQLEITSHNSTQGVFYEYNLRFAMPDHSTLSKKLRSWGCWRITYDNKTVLIGSIDFPAYAYLDNIEPNVFVVKHTSAPPCW